MRLKLHLDNTFSERLPADSLRENTRRQVTNACFSYVEPLAPAAPELIHASDEMQAELGISKEKYPEEFLSIFSGSALLPKSKPYAMCYGGHQFGNWAGQLGDGRAINIGEVLTEQNARWALQLKGAGPTPYSRSADGLAVLRSSIREYLCSEAMHHLGVPTTRALSLVKTGDPVLRDMLYDGNAKYEQGAIVCRAAESFIRFGNFEIFAARKDQSTLKKLADYTIEEYFPHLGVPSPQVYIDWFQEIADRSLEMVIHWQRIGFVHGVMNTDNMSILGLTIDYGPYGWLDNYDPEWTPNTTDASHRRYRYGNQINIVLWNLLQLANAIYPLVEKSEPLENILKGYQSKVPVAYVHMMSNKLGLATSHPDDRSIVNELELLLQRSETDMTLFFRLLSNVTNLSTEALFLAVEKAWYTPEEIKGELKTDWKHWFERYSRRLAKETVSKKDRTTAMKKVNPKYVFRNYMAQLAIEAAEKGDYSILGEMYTLLKSPYAEQPEYEKWFAKRPEWARNKVGCSMLSCSS